MRVVKRLLLPLLVLSVGCVFYCQTQAAGTTTSRRSLSQSTEKTGWLRDSYTGPGGGLSTGPGGGLSIAPGDGASIGPGGGLSIGPGGGLSIGPGGGLSIAPGGGLYNGPCENPYRSNQPPREVFLKELKERGYEDAYKTLKEAWGL